MYLRLQHRRGGGSGALLPELGPPLDPHTQSVLGGPAQRPGRRRPVAVCAAYRELDRPRSRLLQAQSPLGVFLNSDCHEARLAEPVRVQVCLVPAPRAQPALRVLPRPGPAPAHTRYQCTTSHPRHTGQLRASPFPRPAVTVRPLSSAGASAARCHDGRAGPAAPGPPSRTSAPTARLSQLRRGLARPSGSAWSRSATVQSSAAQILSRSSSRTVTGVPLHNAATLLSDGVEPDLVEGGQQLGRPPDVPLGGHHPQIPLHRRFPLSITSRWAARELAARLACSGSA